MTVSYGKIEGEFDAKNGELIIDCEVLLSFGPEKASGHFRYNLKEDEASEWKNIVDRRQKAIENELTSFKVTIKKIRETSSIRPMKISLSQLLDELLTRTLNL
jgi:hypothetical protein